MTSRWRQGLMVVAGVLVSLVLLVVWMRRATPTSSDAGGVPTPAAAPVSVATCLPDGDRVEMGPTDERALHHVLDRLGYGPRRGDLD